MWSLTMTGMAVLVFAADPAASQVKFLSGSGRAVSGTVIVMEDPAGRVINLQLAGLKGPSEGVRCPSADRSLPDWDCGTGARLALASAIAGEILECRLHDGPGEEPVPAECLVQTRNLHHWLLATGWAVLTAEWRGRRPEWDAAELVARRSKAMLWAGADE